MLSHRSTALRMISYTGSSFRSRSSIDPDERRKRGGIADAAAPPFSTTRSAHSTRPASYRNVFSAAETKLKRARTRFGNIFPNTRVCGASSSTLKFRGVYANLATIYSFQVSGPISIKISDERLESLVISSDHSLAPNPLFSWPSIRLCAPFYFGILQTSAV
jgi:hypothetical protein